VKSEVPVSIFGEFVKILEGGPITLSETNCDSLNVLADEFVYEDLSEACAAFQKGEEPPFPGRAVTLRPGGEPFIYDVLWSHEKIRIFAIELKHADQNDVFVHGIKEREKVMENAVATFYLKTRRKLPEGNTKEPFLALMLWEFQKWLVFDSIDATIYSLQQLHELAPTCFDKARLLLLSQCDPAFPDEFRLLPKADDLIIGDAVQMLQTEKNGKAKEASQLLERLKDAGGYDEFLRKRRHWPPIEWPLGTNTEMAGK
jgi:hypothetical protein